MLRVKSSLVVCSLHGTDSELCVHFTAQTVSCHNLREVQSGLQRVPQRPEKSAYSNRLLVSEVCDPGDGTLIGENVRKRMLVNYSSNVSRHSILLT